jgi:hypothetical protein
MTAVRRARPSEFGERYVLYFVDREMYVAPRPRARFTWDVSVWTSTEWGHVVWAVALLVIILVAVLATGNHPEPFNGVRP